MIIIDLIKSVICFRFSEEKLSIKMDNFSSVLSDEERSQITQYENIFKSIATQNQFDFLPSEHLMSQSFSTTDVLENQQTFRHSWDTNNSADCSKLAKMRIQNGNTKFLSPICNLDEDTMPGVIDLMNEEESLQENPLVNTSQYFMQGPPELILHGKLSPSKFRRSFSTSEHCSFSNQCNQIETYEGQSFGLSDYQESVENFLDDNTTGESMSEQKKPESFFIGASKSYKAPQSYNVSRDQLYLDGNHSGNFAPDSSKMTFHSFQRKPSVINGHELEMHANSPRGSIDPNQLQNEACCQLEAESFLQKVTVISETSVGGPSNFEISPPSLSNATIASSLDSSSLENSPPFVQNQTYVISYNPVYTCQEQNGIFQQNQRCLKVEPNQSEKQFCEPQPFFEHRFLITNNINGPINSSNDSGNIMTRYFGNQGFTVGQSVNHVQATKQLACIAHHLPFDEDRGKPDFDAHSLQPVFSCRNKNLEEFASNVEKERRKDYVQLFRCWEPSCNKVFSRRSQRKIHMRMHTGGKLNLIFSN